MGRQLELRITAPNGGRMPLRFESPRGTPDDQVEFLLEQSLRLRTDGTCWCIEVARRTDRTERHSQKRCKCNCHRKGKGKKVRR